ncbi:MAG TPA: hypothetical protein VHB21_07045 [Minicystis sp.]|nr:hypothetical protein [Minicystis sp.]
MVLTYEDGTVPAHTVKYPGARDVKATPAGLTVDGKPFYALGFFDVPFENLGDVAAIQGANTVVWGGSADCFNTDQEVYADKAYDLGLSTVPDFTTTARLATPDVFPAVMKRFANHRAHVALYLADEPDQGYYQYSLIDPAVLAMETMAAHQATTLPLTADLQHAHYDPPAIDEPFSGAVDIYSSEPYGDSLAGVTQSFVVFGQMAPRAVWLFDDTGHTDPTNVVPKAWYGAILGGRSQVYFAWGGGDMGNLAAESQAIGELAQLTDVIYATDTSSDVTAPQGIAFIGRRSGGKTYVIAVNPTTQPITGSFGVKHLAATTGKVLFESRDVAVSGGSFSDTFPPVSRHVYAF